MTWRDRVGDGIATFRGVPILLDSTDASPGRRVQVHEYPERDQPYAEDLGRATRTWSLQGTLVGEDYDAARNKLMNAVEKPGAGEMVHPYYGTHQVVVTSFRVSENTQNGGVAQVSMTVVRADDKPRMPIAVVDTQALVGAKVTAAKSSILSDFEAKFAILDLASDRVAAVQTALTSAMDSVEKVVGGVTSQIAALIRDPVNLGAQILEFVAQMSDSLSEPERALGNYNTPYGQDQATNNHLVAGRAIGALQNLFGAGETATAATNAPNQAQLQVQSQNAAILLVRRSAAIQAASASAGWTYTTSNDALNVLQAVHTGLTDQLDTTPAPGPDLVRTLSELRAATVKDLRDRAAALPSLSTFRPQVTMPALIIAQRLYADASRTGEIILRNNIRHPGAVPGGTDLEVLLG